MRRHIAIVCIVSLASCGAEGDSSELDRNFAEEAIEPEVVNQAELVAFREDALAGCIAGARQQSSAADVPIEAHCACAVDRVTRDRTLADLQASEISGDYGVAFTAALRQCVAGTSPP